MKTIPALLFLLMSITSVSQSTAFTRVGRVDNGRFVLTIDSGAMLAEWSSLLGVTTGFSKMEIIRKETLGERKEEYYLLLASSNALSSSARWLTRKGDDFLLYTGAPEANEKLYLNYYITCTGREDCEPNVMIIEGRYKFGCGTRVECSNTPTGCTAATTIVTD